MKLWIPTAFAFLAIILAIVWGTVLLTDKRVETKTKIVYKAPPKPSIIQMRTWLLDTGVYTAWVSDVRGLGKADCFSTDILGGRHLFSYCKLRKGGFSR